MTSRTRWSEFACEAASRGVMGEPERGKGESGSSRWRCDIPKRPPRLGLPAVEVEVLPDGKDGVGKEGSGAPVEDRPRPPNRSGFREGDDLTERAEVVEFFRPKE